MRWQKIKKKKLELNERKEKQGKESQDKKGSK